MTLVLILHEKKARESDQHGLHLSAREGSELELTPCLTMYPSPHTPQAGLEHPCLSLLGTGFTDVHLHLLLSAFYLLMYVGILPKYMFVPGVGDDQKRVSDPLQVEFQMVLSCLVDAENQSWVLAKAASPLSHCVIPRALFQPLCCTDSWNVSRYVLSVM